MQHSSELVNCDKEILSNPPTHIFIRERMMVMLAHGRPRIYLPLPGSDVAVAVLVWPRIRALVIIVWLTKVLSRK